MKYEPNFIPTPGAVYHNAGGGDFLCIFVQDNRPFFVNVKSGWTFEAHCVNLYENGSIDWNHSTGGHFVWS